MGRPVVHWEFWSRDPQKISVFYEKIFDWKTQFIPEIQYHLVSTGGHGGIDGGIMTPKPGPWPGNMAMYIDVDNLETYVNKIKEAGGKIIVDKQTIPGVGFFALFEDPDGRVLGIWQKQT